ncbi:hypothetical protein OJAV_G00203710 [Oryzias javanicus]|uniref:Ig-like domain-containing protein n=1 Tax=Oryzias javanicus TaxID=123683 RepID=A0A437C5A4_ORYJA|nr:hypothetical protein OJAV_G00203710 [Oryzias javanicus]
MTSGQPLPPSVKVVGPTLQFSSQSNDLSGLYECETTNPYGSKRAYLYVDFSAGNCSLAWVLIGLLVFLTVLGAVYLHRTVKLQSIWSALWVRSNNFGQEAPQTPKKNQMQKKDS